jgi:hypothetical protein
MRQPGRQRRYGNSASELSDTPAVAVERRREDTSRHLLFVDAGLDLKERAMLGFSGERHPPPTRLAELQHYLRTLEPLLARAINAPGDRGRTDGLADTIAERLGDLAERARSGAARAGSEASRLGSRFSSAGRDSLAHLSREAGANPLIALAAVVGIGLIVGAVLLRSSGGRRRQRVRRSRKG